MSEQWWMYAVDDRNIFLGQVDVLKRRGATSVLRKGVRASGFRTVVDNYELFLSREEALANAITVANMQAAKLRTQADQLTAMIAAAARSSGEFDGWMFRPEGAAK